ncbi:MAG: DSD1 family PLP-dependent enzyme [Alphaproteobacteria bacterium]
MNLDSIDTPALLLDLDKMDANIAFIAARCREFGVNWRPHFKSHKTIEIARRQIAAGAIGVTCAKLGEAEVLADAGIRDILIANQIVGPIKIARLMALLDKADVIVSVDSMDNIAELAAAGKKLRVVIEVDTGMNRAGVLPGEAVVALANEIARYPSLKFCGVMSWEVHAAAISDQALKEKTTADAIGSLTASADACRAAGHDVSIVSAGGTGTLLYCIQQPGVTEVQIGGAIFNDEHYRQHFGVTLPQSLTILTTVTSRPTPTRVVVDAGRKAMSWDAGMPRALDVPPVASLKLSAEHAQLELEMPSATPRIGERIAFVPGYTDTTIHLHEEINAIRGGKIEAVWKVSARGKIK